MPYSKFVKCTTCLRTEFAVYLGDTSQAGISDFFHYRSPSRQSDPRKPALTPTTRYCCNGAGCSGIRFGLQDFPPEMLPLTLPPPSVTKRMKQPDNAYRPTQEHLMVDYRLIK